MVEALSRSQRILGGARDDGVLQASAVMTAFERMWGSMRVLAADHPNRREYLGLFMTVLEPALELGEYLQFDLEPYRVLMDGQEVFTLDREVENYVYRLYQDGVRRLAFHKNVSLEEVERFVGVLMEMFSAKQKTEDDIVTLLWAAELENITYQAIESFVEGSGDDVGQTQENKLIDEIGVDNVIQYATAASTITDQSIDTSRLVDRKKGFQVDDKKLREFAAELLDGVVEDKQSQVDQAIRVDEETKEALAGQLAESGAMNGSKVGEVIHRTTTMLGDRADEVIHSLLTGFAHDNLAEGTCKPLFDVIGTVQALNTMPGNTPIELSLFDVLKEPVVLNGLVELLRLEKDVQEANMLIKMIGSSSLPLLWDELVSTQDLKLRKKLRELMGTHADKHQDFLAEQIQIGTEESALQALSLLRRTDYARNFQSVLPALKSPHVRVRVDVVQMLRKVQDPQAWKFLPRLLSDPSEEVRLAVLDILAHAEGFSLESTLMALVKDEKFASRSEHEQKRVMSLFGRIAADKGLSLVRDLAMGQARNSANRFLRVLAIEILGVRKDNTALSELTKLGKGLMTNKEIKQAARKAAEQIRAGQRR